MTTGIPYRSVRPRNTMTRGLAEFRILLDATYFTGFAVFIMQAQPVNRSGRIQFTGYEYETVCVSGWRRLFPLTLASRLNARQKSLPKHSWRRRD